RKRSAEPTDRTAAAAAAAADAAASPAPKRRTPKRVDFESEPALIQDAPPSVAGDNSQELQPAERLQQLQQLVRNNDDATEVAREMARLLGVSLALPTMVEAVKHLQEARKDAPAQEDVVMEEDEVEESEREEDEEEEGAEAPEEMEMVQPTKVVKCATRVDTADKLQEVLLQLRRTEDDMCEMMSTRCAVEMMIKENEGAMNPMTAEQIVDEVMIAMRNAVTSVLADDDVFAENAA
ncbi:hypothetical protein PRIPAC_83602, partial [Pristionchus pacificus]|uniref:Uncharacterized protein n=1 Tax=Pristionchus pacificus TaxID=54126 RepID=A0A2A6BSC2_PRIPA